MGVFGLKLCISVYTIVDIHATKLQGDKVNISVAISIVNNLIMELTQQCDNLDVFLDEVLEERFTNNTLARDSTPITTYNYYDEIENPTCPSTSKKKNSPLKCK